MLILFMIMLHASQSYIKVANYCSLLHNTVYVVLKYQSALTGTSRKTPWPQAIWLTCSTRTICSHPVPCVTGVSDPITIVPPSVVTLSITWCGGHTARDSYTWQNDVVPYLNAIINTFNKLKVTYYNELKVGNNRHMHWCWFVHEHAPSQSYIKVANYCSLLYNILYVCSVKVSKWTYVNK